MILGVDPGFASFGWVLMTPGLSVRAAGVIETKKDPRKVLVSVDVIRRVREISSAIGTLVNGNVNGYGDVNLVCAESLSHPRHAAAAAKVALAWGALACECEANQIPIVQMSPQAIKKKVAGKSNASKAQIASQLADVRGVSCIEEWPKSKREHIWDALAAVYAARETDIFLAVRGKGAA